MAWEEIGREFIDDSTNDSTNAICVANSDIPNFLGDF